ncbi:Cytochrome P450 [Corchorus olitorius]|uniref:Cytochrome P450 n=1 Tax=Corchorus olitorius TaxID=93759 RepID=A0A1R3I8E0_9ROSI|nr:Cytochrome P450 [Corchorus olitorius]
MSKIRAYGIWPWLWEIDIITLCNANFAFLVTLSAISLWFMWTIKKSTKARKSSLPPGPRGLPLVGYLPFLGTNLVEVLPELAKLYGPIYKLWLGQKLCVVISSPSLVKEVVREKDTIFGNHDATIAAKMSSYGGNDIAFTPYGHEWRKLRKVFAHDMVGNASLERTRNLRRKEVTKIIRDVYKNAGKATDFGELAFTISINTMISMLWGGKVEGAEVVANKEAEFREIFANLTRLLGSPNVSDVFPSLARFDIQGIGRQIKEIAAWFEEFLNALIDARTNSFDAVKEEEDGNGGEKDFLQILLELIGKEDNASSITMDQLKAILMV